MHIRAVMIAIDKSKGCPKKRHNSEQLYHKPDNITALHRGGVEIS